jgi:2-polyprenyl-6-methoxyphenol hydroxylase-like FAD-dependent oxidoreductase
MQPKVLIVGAGPTGLVLALWLVRLRVEVRIIDQAPQPGTTSRAMIVHARTLEFYDQLGIAASVIGAGEKAVALNAHLNRKLFARIPFGDFGKGLSPYPFMLVLPQDVHERVLQEQITSSGITVEQGSRLLGFEQDGDMVRARIETAWAEETVCADYLCGCDGAHSTVREHLGIGFPGGTYEQVFYVADAAVAGALADDEVHFALSGNDIFAIFPLKHRRAYRLIGVVPPDIEKEIHTIAYDDVAGSVYRNGGLTASRVHWFSTYHVHHRVAASFGKGRVFLLGDAAHIHSPAGGQGMNTGIGDATNLAWKLAAVLQRRAAPAILNSYQVERTAIAHRIVETTDRIFSFQVSPSWRMRTARRLLIPLMPALMRMRYLRRLVFRSISQLAFHYRLSSVSAGSAGRIRAGDRLPWVRYDDALDNFATLRNLEWQAHVYGVANAPLRQTCADADLALRELPWTPAAYAAGLGRDALYLVRPDGHIALAVPNGDPVALASYLARLELSLRPRSART